MSNVVEQFDPSLGGTKFTAPNSAVNGALVFWNESNISLDLEFADGTDMYLPAWYHRKKCGATGSVNIVWSVNTQLNSPQPPMSAVVVEAYASGEPVPNDGPLVRQANVGNVLNTVGGTATSIQNDNNINGTSVVEATVAGDGASALSIANNGQANFGSALHPGAITLTGASAFVQAPVYAAPAGNNLAIEAPNGFAIRLFAGVTFVGFIDANGLTMLAGSITLPLIGSISGISKFSGTATTTPTAFAHGLGAIPDLVLLTLTGTNTSLSMVKYDAASLTSTNVTVISDSSRTFVGLAIKF